jgi:hypothetical protein
MITVIAGWIIGWSAIGAWKMATANAGYFWPASLEPDTHLWS